MGYGTDMARELKKRNNDKYEGGIIGIVVSDQPDIKISIYEGQIILDKERLYFTDAILMAASPIELYDELLLLPNKNGQYFYVIDRIRKLG